jgi:gliding motility-associated-like protein
MIQYSFAQSPSAIYEFSDSRMYTYTDADVYALKDGNVLIIHTNFNPNSDREFDYIVFQEFDSCGLVNSNTIQIEPLIGFVGIYDFKERGDSLYFAGRGSATYAEGVFMTLHRSTLAGRYRYFRSVQGMTINSFDFKKDGGFILSGFNSSTGPEPSRYVSIQLDAGYHTTAAKQFIPSFTFTGGVTTISDRTYLVRSSEQITLFDQNYRILWTHMFDRPTTGELTFVESDGIVTLFYGWYGDSELQVIKLDFNGNIMWTSPRLNSRVELDGNARLIRKANGDYLVVHQYFDFEQIEGDIEVTTLSREGDVVDQYAIATPKNLAAFEWMKEVAWTEDALWVVMSNLTRDFKVYRADQTYDICGLKAFAYQNNEPYDWLQPGPWFSFFDLDVERGSYELIPHPVNVNFTDICAPPYPLYDLMPDDTTLCETYSLEINLDTIFDPVFWSDGSTAKRRILSEAGSYSYGYGVCQNEYAETVHISFDDCRCKAFIPNSFSPNNDGINDVFQVFIPCDYDADNELKIFDRWGSKIFHSQPLLQAWDGQVEGKSCAEGIYIYEYTYRDTAVPGQPLVRRLGEVMLMR